MSKQELGKVVMAALATIEFPVCVLRGLDAHARESGDVDLIVPPGLATRACLLASCAALNNGWFLAGFRDIGYVCSVTLLKPSEDGKCDAVKLDFINGFAWYGIGGRKPIANPFSERWQPIHQGWTDPRITGVLTFFQKIMASGSVSPKEWNRIAATGVDPLYVAEVAGVLDLPITLAEIEARVISRFKKWSMRAASAGVNNPVSILVWFLHASVAHLNFKLGIGTKAGLVLGISGLDGSGKSTLVDRLIAAYRKAGGVQPQLVHLLPSWIPMPHQILRRSKTQSNYTRPYSEPPVSSRLNGALRLAFYLCAFTLARLSLWIGMKRGRLIILDRSFLDFASDLTRSRIPAQRLPGWLIRALVPEGQLFYLDASPEVVVARKSELTLEKARALQASYRDTCATIGATLLDGDAKPDAVFRELLGHLSQEYMRCIEAAEAHK